MPTLAPGNIVIMDNPGSHKGQAGHKAIRSVGVKLLFLPPYSPDLNPIEQVFAKLKLLLRKAAERPVEDTWRRIGALLDAFPPPHCANYFSNRGHASCYMKKSLAALAQRFADRDQPVEQRLVAKLSAATGHDAINGRADHLGKLRQGDLGLALCWNGRLHEAGASERAGRSANMLGHQH